MWHPLDSLPLRLRQGLLFALVVALIVIFCMLQLFSRRIQGKGNSRPGVVGFALAGSADQSQCVVNSWKDARVLKTACRSLHLDFAFIFCYSVSLSYAWTCAARGYIGLREQPADSKWFREPRIPFASTIIAMLLAIGVWVAGLLDVVENCALLYMLNEGVSCPWPMIAAAAAYPKFAVLIVACAPVLLIPFMVIAWPLLRLVPLVEFSGGTNESRTPNDERP